MFKEWIPALLSVFTFWFCRHSLGDSVLQDTVHTARMQEGGVYSQPHGTPGEGTVNTLNPESYDASTNNYKAHLAPPCGLDIHGDRATIWSFFRQQSFLLCPWLQKFEAGCLRSLSGQRWDLIFLWFIQQSEEFMDESVTSLRHPQCVSWRWRSAYRNVMVWETNTHSSQSDFCLRVRDINWSMFFCSTPKCQRSGLKLGEISWSCCSTTATTATTHSRLCVFNMRRTEHVRLV